MFCGTMPLRYLEVFFLSSLESSGALFLAERAYQNILRGPIKHTFTFFQVTTKDLTGRLSRSLPSGI